MNLMRSTHPSSLTEVSTATRQCHSASRTLKRPIKDVNGMFKDLMGKSMEVYMDDILVQSKIAGDHIGHLN